MSKCVFFGNTCTSITCRATHFLILNCTKTHMFYHSADLQAGADDGRGLGLHLLQGPAVPQVDQHPPRHPGPAEGGVWVLVPRGPASLRQGPHPQPPDVLHLQPHRHLATTTVRYSFTQSWNGILNVQMFSMITLFHFGFHFCLLHFKNRHFAKFFKF